MNPNPHTILPISCMMLAIFCGIFVILQNSKAKLNRLFLGVCITFAVWFSFYIPFNFHFSDQSLLIWFKIAYCFISFIPITCFTFITTYLDIPQNKLWFKINCSVGLIFSILSISSNWIIQGVSYYPWYPYPNAGIIHPLLILHCIYLSLFSIKLLLKAFKNPSISDKQRNHMKYMISAVVALSLGIPDFIGNYNVPIYNIGFIPVSAYLIITTIAVIKHQLMDIRIVIRKSVIYSLLITLVTLIYLISILIIERLSQNIIGYQNLLNSVSLSILIALIFIPLKNIVQNFVEKTIFHGSYVQIAEQNELLRQEIIQTEKFKAVATLASGLAHEIKNPLTILQTFSEYLPLKKDDPEFMAKYLSIVPKEIERMNGLVQDMLDFAKPSPPEFKMINPNDLIFDLVSLIQQKCANNKIAIDCQLGPNVTLSADPNQLKQALLNILLNAIDAMPQGGQLTVNTQNETNHFIINIKDTGTGIAPEDLKHIFDPFFSKKEKGTGLGLAITQGIIEKHTGIIEVLNEPNKGTMFSIKFKATKGVL